MIALDTSALMAILLGEPRGPACSQAVRDDPDRMISAATLAEALIVAERRSIGEDMSRLLDLFGPQVIPVTAATARAAANAYASWGKGVHPAKLNLMDCFSYDAAQANGCPLLYVGQDFAQTDVASALPAADA